MPNESLMILEFLKALQKFCRIIRIMRSGLLKSVLQLIGISGTDTFTQIYIDYLCEAAEVEDGNVCFHEGRGVKVNGYSISEDETSIVLFVSIYKNSPSLYSVPPSEASAMLGRAKQFYLKALKKYQAEIEEAYSAFDLARSIYDYGNKITEVKILLLTNGTIRSTILEPEEAEGITFYPSVWDLERIYASEHKLSLFVC